MNKTGLNMEVINKRKPFECKEPKWASGIWKIIGYGAASLILCAVIYFSLWEKRRLIEEMLITAFNVSWPFFGTALLCFVALKLMGEVKPTHEILKAWWKGEPAE